MAENEQYQLTLRQEVLVEAAAEVYAGFCNYAKSKLITDDHYPTVLMEQQLFQLKNKILKMNTMVELERVLGQLEFAREHLRLLKGGEVDERST